MDQTSEFSSHVVKVSAINHSISRVEFDEAMPFGSNWTSLVGAIKSAIQVILEGSIVMSVPQARLLVLSEGGKFSIALFHRLTINGREIKMDVASSDTGWAATVQPVPEHWTFLLAPLSTGMNAVNRKVFAGTDCSNVLIWV